ncbi:MAG: Protein TolB [Steroidobacteraceae bacterium]|nr:Protein TolB [Steroidobacteraceae bacterium]
MAARISLIALALAMTVAGFAGGAETTNNLPLKPTRHIEFDTTQGTWMSLDLSPDGRTLVFDLLGDLYTLPVEGGDAHRLTSGLPFDSQPVYSPDGASIAFVSDRSGAENLWVARADGSQARQLSFQDDHNTFISPEWSSDGRTLYVQHHQTEGNAIELWSYPADAPGARQVVLPFRSKPDQASESWRHVLGAHPSADGRYLYYAAHVGDFDYDKVPEWTIRRLDLATRIETTLIAAPRGPRPDLSLGTAFRPRISPDGRTLVYATRLDGRTGLRVLDLVSQEDRRLAYPVQQGQLMSLPGQDLLPRYVFTPDGKSLLLANGGGFEQLDLATGKATPIPFRAHVALDVGPNLRVPIKRETGPVRARLIQDPLPSPDGRRIAFSALGHAYVMDLRRGASPRRLTSSESPEFHPSWSPDGKRVLYVTWTAAGGGQVWVASLDGHVAPTRLTTTAAFYTHPVFTPDGRDVLVVRSSNSVRMHTYLEYGNLREAELVRLPATGGDGTVIVRDTLGGLPQFTARPGSVFLNFGDGLNAVALDGSGRERVVGAQGPGWYFVEGPGSADDIRISPDGRWALVQITQQLHLIEVPTGKDRVIDLLHPVVKHRRLTDVGADFFAWADGGKTITWAVGSTFYRRPLASVVLNDAGAPGSAADVPVPGHGGVEAFQAVVRLPRDTPKGVLVLRGATVVTMRGDEVLRDADVVIRDDHIAAVGRRGQVNVPRNATIRDVSGKYIVPGFIDAHDHIADIRRNVLDFEPWGPLTNLAYGVTTGFDPSPLSIDMLAYEDLVDAGLVIGSRIHSTGPALFSFNRFESLPEVEAVLSRNKLHYHTLNLKEYRTGNRRVRQWVAIAAHDQGILPTCEGALSVKLDLTQIQDGFAGNEHSLPTVPLYDDVVQLMARTGVSYVLTLMIAHGGPLAQDYYITRTAPHDDPKYNRFAPHYVVDIKFLQRTWRDPREYLFPRVAESAAKVLRAGGLLGVGSHGEVPGLGFHWEMQAYAAGGMTPHEVLRAATLGSATTIGRAAEFGSIEPGKFADLVVLDRNPLEDIANTLAIHAVMKNGRLYDGATLDEVYPRRRALPAPWFRRSEVE